MHTLIVPLVQYDDPGAGRGFRPDLPDSILYGRPGAHWGQASSVLSSPTNMCVVVSLPPTASAQLVADRDALLARPDVTVLARSAPDLDTAQMRAAFRGTPGTGRDRAVRDYLAAYRATAKAEEDRRAQAAAATRLGMLLLPMILLHGLRAVAARYGVDVGFLGWGVEMATTWALLATEDFAKVHNSNLAGQSTTTGSLTWSTPLTAESLRARSPGECAGYTGNHRFGFVNSALGTQRVECTIINTAAFGGPICRVQGASGYEHYGFDNSGASTSNVRRWTTESSFTTLASSSQTWTAGMVARIDAEGSALTSLIDDVVETGPTTDTTYPTGDAGVRVKSNGGQSDDFAVYQEDAGGGGSERAPSRNQPIHNFRGHVVAASF